MSDMTYKYAAKRFIGRVYSQLDEMQRVIVAILIDRKQLMVVDNRIVLTCKG